MASLPNFRSDLNKCLPAADAAKLGDVLYDLIAAYNDLAAKYNALLAHLDTANVAGIGNANATTYSATVKPAVLTPEQRVGVPSGYPKTTI